LHLTRLTTGEAEECDEFIKAVLAKPHITLVAIQTMLNRARPSQRAAYHIRYTWAQAAFRKQTFINVKDPSGYAASKPFPKPDHQIPV